jgi:hypothetical protein
LQKEKLSYYLLIFTVLVFSVLINSGCYKFKGDQTVPAYLKIDTAFLNTYYPSEGSKSQKITDVWIYINDNIAGTFELPAMFPILAEGPNELEIRPGIKINGISSTRVPYPFYKPFVISDFEFVPDSVLEIKSVELSYYYDLVFAWKEDFESGGISIEENPASDTVIMKVARENSPDPGTKNAGAIYLTAERPIYSGATYQSYEMPKQGSPVVLEMDYKTNNYLNTGLLIRDPAGYVKVPLVIVNHSDKWNKIYINLGPNLSLHSQASEFRVYFEAGLDKDKSSSTILIDNLKIIHRPN